MRVPSNLGAGAIISERYRLERELGRGGMAVVYEATDLALRVPVAIKVLNHNVSYEADSARRLIQEARILLRFRSKHAVRVLEVGLLEDTRPFMVMERLWGTSLQARLLERGPLPTAIAIDYALQTCEVLAEAHALGIVHRDIKPDNLLLVPDADGAEIVKVLDFGIAKFLRPGEAGSAVTNTEVALGTPAFMAPEQLARDGIVDDRADLWSLAVTLSVLITGRVPFAECRDSSAQGRTPSLDAPIQLDETPQLPSGLRLVLLACLERDAWKRPPSVVAAAKLLAPYGTKRSASSLDAIARAVYLDPDGRTISRVFEEPRGPSEIHEADETGTPPHAQRRSTTQEEGGVAGELGVIGPSWKGRLSVLLLTGVVAIPGLLFVGWAVGRRAPVTRESPAVVEGRAIPSGLLRTAVPSSSAAQPPVEASVGATVPQQAPRSPSALPKPFGTGSSAPVSSSSAESGRQEPSPAPSIDPFEGRL